jgi:iron complex outermembrane receptor protein
VKRRAADVATAVSGVLRALSICTPVALLGPTPTLAQSIQSATLVTDIPARPLAEALATLASQTGLQIVYVSDVVRDRKSRPVSAGLSADKALTRLLQGSGLRFEFLTPHSVRILAAATPRERAAAPRVPDELSEVIVTANRREEGLQHVPMTIQVLTGEMLASLNAYTFDDLVSDLPGVTARGVGPGQNNIYVRGLATAVPGIQGAGFGGAFPNVAVYLDEQSAQLPGRNLDVYAADLQRIEILEGPQGTLFGAGAEAGVVRYITNKPKLDVTEVTANAGTAITAHGAPSSNGDVVVNMPVLAGRLAVRGVLYNEHRGGYIDNRPARFTRANTDLGIRYAGGSVPANSVAIDNFNLATSAINPVTYQGARVAALYQFSDDWSALLAQSYQNLAADGVFAEMAADSLGAPQPDLTVQLYNLSYDRDRFENTALTVDGRMGALTLLYAGAYLVRNIEQVQDYTNYARGPYADYYQCVVPIPANPASAQCFSPSSTWRDRQRNTHLSQELRLSTPADWPIRGVGGLFYEDYRIQDQVDWLYRTATPYFTPIAPPTGYYTVNGATHLPNGDLVRYYTNGAVFVPFPVTANNPNVRPPTDAFFNDYTRGYKQRAAYASVDIELVPQTLTLTAGTRYFRTYGSELGSSAGSFGCKFSPGQPKPPDPCINHSPTITLDTRGIDGRYAGFRSRANLSWQLSDDALLYYTWSQGYRVGGFNRDPNGCLCASPLAYGNNALATQHGGWQTPATFAPDNLTNNEFGWKTTWAGRRLQWQGTIYQEDWNHAQIVGTGFIPGGISINGGDYRVRGIESAAVARIGARLTVRASGAWNRSELVKQAVLRWTDGTPIDFAALQLATGQAEPDPSGELGSPLAAPPFQGHLRARYEFVLNGYDAFAQVGATHQSHSLSTTNRLNHDLQGHSTAYDLPSFTTFDAALGIGREAWLVQLYGQNLTDTRSQLYADYAQFYKAVTVGRPRTIGLRLDYRFADR